MIIDLVIIIIFIISSLIGYLKGGLNQFFSIFALFCSIIISPYIGKYIYSFVSDSYNLDILFLSPLFTLISSILIYIIIKILGRVFERLIIGSSNILIKSNRLLGLGIGSFKSAIFIMILIMGLGYLSRFHSGFNKKFSLIRKHSYFVKLVEDINPTKYLEIIPQLIKLKEKINFIPKENKVYKRIMDNEKIKNFLTKDKLEKILKGDSLFKIIRNKEIKELYNDGEVREILKLLDANRDKNNEFK